MGKLQRKVSTKWSPELAYAIGLLTTDGYLNNDQRHIGLKAKDLELIKNLKDSLCLTNKISSQYRRINGPLHYYITFGDVIFYRFLNKIGLTSCKSKTIKKVDIPRRYFADFIRGVFDGDGTFYTFWDRRWPKSFGYQIAFSSASKIFINWLRQKLKDYYGLHGVLHQGKGVINLRYVKGYTRELFTIMYYCDNLHRLTRKYEKMKQAFEYDRLLHEPR